MLKIRIARKEDAKDLATINTLGWKTTYRGLVPDELLDTRTVTQKRIERFENQILEYEICLVAENETGIIGYLLGGKTRDDGVPYEYEMYALYVHPDFQRVGVGTDLFNTFKEKIKGASFCVYALDGNTKGINFYQKMGGIRSPEFDKDQEVFHYVIHEVLLAFEGEKMGENLTIVAPENLPKMRLDKFLADSFPDYSRNQFIHLIEAGAVQIIGQNTGLSPDDKVVAGATYTIIPPEPTEPDPEPENIPLDIVYEDNDLLVVNKPAGLVVHPGAGNWTGTLVNALLYHCGDSLSGINGVKRPGIVHRIDKDTSGLLVIAKNDKAHVGLAKQFEVHSIQRTYDAFVWGLTPESGRIEGNIGRSSTNRQKMTIVKVGGKPAVTHYERVDAYGITASHIKCHLETGRTHQIRVHMTSIKHPLIGDEIYGHAPKSVPENIRFFPRQALHAGLLGFIHPITQKQMMFEAPLPQDLIDLKKQLADLI